MQVERIEQAVENHAPGFRDLVVARSIQTPGDLEDGNANLVSGAVNGGTAGIHQQLVFRPVPGLARAETPFDGLYLASSSAHPGGGVHGGPGANAARAALARRKWSGRARRRLLDSAYARIYC
jgi:phytoene dehydrogenase-like protein